MAKSTQDVYKMVTDRIIAELEQGKIPWNKPWRAAEDAGGARSHRDGRRYSLLNQLLLGGNGEYITFKQVQEAGGRVKKGAKSKPVVFWKRIKVKEKDEQTGEITEKVIPFLQQYAVFEIADTEGIERKFSEGETTFTGSQAEAIEAGEDIIKTYEAREAINICREEMSAAAYYQPSNDSIHVPCIGQFERANEYYSTLFHEMTHSTGAGKRLDRDMSGRFGSKSYSKEELIAEMGAAMLMTTAGIDTEGTTRNSAAYVQSWLRALKDDVSLVVLAAGKAEKAVDYIMTGKKPSYEASAEG